MSRFPQMFPAGGSSGPLLPVGWDRLSLGGIALAGRAQLTAGSLRLKVDPKKKAGAISQKPTTHGLDAQEFTARLVVWTQEQLDDADEQLAALLPPVNQTPVTLDHPQAYTLARMIGKIDVLVTGGSIWMPSSIVRGGREMTLNLLHWPAAAKGKGVSTTPKQPINLLALKKQGLGIGTVLAPGLSQQLQNNPPTSSPDFAKPSWP
jgi:hypothetical protein